MNKYKGIRELNTDKCVSIGRFSDDIVKFIVGRVPDLQGILSSENEIIFWDDRIDHIYQHEPDFFPEGLFEKCLDDIPSFVTNPDYIAVRMSSSKGNSISLIKEYSQNIAVVIRVMMDGKLSFRTMYPLMSSQLDRYLNEGSAWKYKNI